MAKILESRVTELEDDKERSNVVVLVLEKEVASWSLMSLKPLRNMRRL